MSNGTNQDDFDTAEREMPDRLKDELEVLKKRHRNDPPFDLLQAAAAHALPEELQEDVSHHLEESQWSRALLEGGESVETEFPRADEDRLLSRIQSQIGKEAAPRGGWAWLWRPAITFAAIALVAFAVWRWSPWKRTSQTTKQPPSTQIPAPVKPASILALEKPEIRFTENAIIVRGNKQSGLLNDLAPGINAFREGDYARAEEDLAALQQRYPNSVEVFFYLGVSRLFLKDIQGATRALKRARNTHEESFAPDIAWYMAIADEQAGQREDAQSELGALCKGKSSYAASACAAAAKFASKTEATSPR